MKRLFCLLAVSFPLLLAAGTPDRPFTFAWLSDVHFDSFAYAEDDLRRAVDDINANPDVAFTLLSGDLCEFGATHEYEAVKPILDKLQRPLLLIPGNHDVNWSENGCTAFDRFFGASHFVRDVEGIRFIGCGAGPALRMGPPWIPMAELRWLDSVVLATPAQRPIVFVNHFPVDRGLANGYEVLRILKQRNIVAILCGHGHVNHPFDFEGIPGAMGRSSLRRSDPVGGYNLAHVAGGRITLRERTIGVETHDPWLEIPLHSYDPAVDTVGHFRPDYALDGQNPSVREVWRLRFPAEIAAPATLQDRRLLVATVDGQVRCVDVRTGRTAWEYRAPGNLYGAPAVGEGRTVVTATDGTIRALEGRGRLLWCFETGYPLVSAPLIADGTVYAGGSDGRFFALDLKDGAPRWIAEGLRGFVEARPAVDDQRVYIGTWDAMFYALDRSTGAVVWSFDTGRGRYFSPGACWPTVVDGRVIELSSDYFVRAFDPATGEIRWASDEARGRESIGFSPDRKTMYLKGIGETFTAVDLTAEEYKVLWRCPMPWESNFIPTRMPATDRLIFVPTEFGVVHALRTDGKGIAWSRKVSHAAITSLTAVGGDRLVVGSMDGSLVCLAY